VIDSGATLPFHPDDGRFAEIDPRQARRTCRDKRLARALRDNLHRRKQQARGRAQCAAEPAADPPRGEPPA